METRNTCWTSSARNGATTSTGDGLRVGEGRLVDDPHEAPLDVEAAESEVGPGLLADAVETDRRALTCAAA